MTKKLLTSIFLFLTCVTLWAKPDFDSSKKYHIVCSQFTSGCVTDGASAGMTTPLFYLTSTKDTDETYWMMTEQGEGQFTIRNAKTGQYITYDGVRSDNPLRRYVSMTDNTDGDKSLWTFDLQSEGIYTIRNVSQNDHIWDVRTDSYCVGTYSNTGAGNQNQCFYLFDADGQLVVEKVYEAPLTDDGFDVSTWLVATTDAIDRWTANGGWFLNTGAGGSHFNDNDGSMLVAPFIENWHESSNGPLEDCSLTQVLAYLPAGQYSLQADIMACRQGYNSWGSSMADTPATNVVLFAGNNTLSVATNNDPPQRFMLNFNLTEAQDLELGIRAEGTNANWIAIDNVVLYYHGTENELLEGEKAKVKAELAGYYTAKEIEALMANTGNSFSKLETLRRGLANLPARSPLANALSDLIIDKHGVSYVSDLEIALYSLPLEHFGTNYKATVTYEKQDGWDDLTINGTKVPSGSTYTFRNIFAERQYTFQVKKSDNSESVNMTVVFTSLPVVSINGTFSDNYSEGNIFVQEPDRYQLDLMNMKAKWRGGITNTSGKHKRNYHVKLLDNEGNKMEKSFFGLRNDNSWILESCQVDMSRIRNRILTDLWNAYSVKPYYFDKEPKAMTGTRGRFVELILNGEYRGIYCMTENLDRKQMKLKKYDEETGAIHGQLWKSKDWSYAVFMGHNRDNNYYPGTPPVRFNNRNESWDQYYVKYPNIDDVYPTDWQVLYDAVNFVCTASDNDFSQQFSEYFDMPLVIDYYILMETILSTDNHGKNMFFAVYDKQVDKKITFSVWDMDATSGQRWSDDYYHQSFLGPEQDYAEFITRYEHGDYNLFRRLRNTNADDFNMQVRLRYRDLRQTELATDAIISRFEKQIEEFKTSGAGARESAKWSYDSDVSYLPIDFDEEMEYLRDWFTRRMNYLDNIRFDIASLPSGIQGVQTEAKSTTVVIYNINGQKVATARRADAKDVLSTLPAGIYIVDGKKVAVSN